MSFSNYDTTELIEYLPEALFLEDWDGKILDVNSQACELLGYSKEELLNQDVDKIVPEGNPVLLPDQIDEATMSGKPIETINVKKDGTKVPVEIRGRIIKVDGKERILVSVRDTSERKRSEDELRESEKKFRNLAQTTSTAIGVFQNNKWIYANPAGEEISGYSSEELKTMKFWDFVAPEFKEKVKERGKKREGGIEALSGYEFKIITKQGEEKWVHLEGTSTEYEGEPARLISVVDITERKRAEEALKREKRFSDSIINAIPDTVFVFDPQTGKAVRWNRAFKEASGYTDEEIAAKKAPDDWYIKEEVE